jgi:hypothetical protein
VFRSGTLRKMRRLAPRPRRAGGGIFSASPHSRRLDGLPRRQGASPTRRAVSRDHGPTFEVLAMAFRLDLNQRVVIYRVEGGTGLLASRPKSGRS